MVDHVDVKRRILVATLRRDSLNTVIRRFKLQPRMPSMYHCRIAVLEAWNGGNAEVGVMVFDLLMKEAQL